MQPLSPAKQLIVYVDDDPDDHLLVELALKPYMDTIELKSFTEAEVALDYLLLLKNEEKRPCLIMLDFNMPGLSGKELLPLLRGIEHYQSVPVFMFTTSSLTYDQYFAVRHGAIFVTKPLDFSQMNEVVNLILSTCQSAAKGSGRIVYATKNTG